MSARTEPYTDLQKCAEPNCECHTKVVQAGKKVIVENILLSRADVEVRMCLLCYFARGQKYRGPDWKVIEVNRIKFD